jgi:hypothetical protein
VPEGKEDKLTKKIVVLAILLFIAGTISGQEFTFRGIPWGSTVEDIIAKEGQPDSNTHGQLIYKDKIVAGYNSSLLFYFSTPYSDPYAEKLSLSTAQYIIAVSNANSQAIYNDLLGKLSTLYGTPTLGTKPGFKVTDRYNYWIVSRTRITLTLLVDLNIKHEGSLIFISYHSPDSIMNEFDDL